MSEIFYIQNKSTLEVNVELLLTVKLAVKLKRIIIGFLVVMFVLISAINWNISDEDFFTRSMFISTFEQLFFVALSTAAGFLLYQFLLRVLIRIFSTSAKYRPNFFKGTLDQVSQLLMFPIFFLYILSDLFEGINPFPIFFNFFVLASYLSFLIIFDYSSYKSDKDSFMRTIITKEIKDEDSSIEYTDYVPLIGKTLQNVSSIEKNKNGNYQIGISYLSGTKVFGLDIPITSRHLSSYEFNHFHEMDFGSHMKNTFTIVLMDGSIIQDDIKPNDPRFKGKIFGPIIGSTDDYNEVKTILKMIGEYIPIEIIRPIKYSRSFTGLKDGFKEEPDRPS